jgi:hypothetical protein
MPITYSERPITEQERELSEADIRAWQQYLVQASRRYLYCFVFFLATVFFLGVAVMCWRTEIVWRMVLGVLIGFFWLLFAFFIGSNFWWTKETREALQESITTKQRMLERGMVQVVRVETEKVVLYDTGDEDMGAGYFIQIEPEETLYLSCSHWNGDHTEEIPISNDDVAPVIHTSFELAVEGTLSTYHPLGEVLSPCAILTHEDFAREEPPPPHRSFRLSSESGVMYFFPEDGAIYDISLTDLLENPTKIHDVTQDFSVIFL